MKNTCLKILFGCGMAFLLGTPQARLVSAIAAFSHLDTRTFAALPPLLSGTGLYDDVSAPNRQVTAGIVPYQINTPVWNDYTVKERFLQLPAGAAIEPALSGNDHYQFPDSTIFVQNFYLDTIRGDSSSRILLETRFLIIRSQYNSGTGASDTAAFGLSYWWRRDQTDAMLVNPLGGLSDTISVWIGGALTGMYRVVPRSGECRSCHVNRKALGFITPQLNRDINGVNQLDAMVTAGILTANPVAGIPGSFRWAGLDDTAASWELRARSYFGANCSHCHGNGVSNTGHTFDFFSLLDDAVYDPADFTSTGYIGKPASSFQYNYFISPGHPDSSFILFRMLSRGTPANASGDQMPLYGTYQVDSAAIWAVANWTCELGGIPLAQCTLPNESAPPLPEGVRKIHGKKSPRFEAVISQGRLILAEDGPRDLQLRNLSGKLIRMSRVTAHEYLLPESALSGVYFLTFGTNTLRISYLR